MIRRRNYISAFIAENFMKIKLDMTWQEFKKKLWFYMKYIGKYLSGEDIWPITETGEKNGNLNDEKEDFKVKKKFLSFSLCVQIYTKSNKGTVYIY